MNKTTRDLALSAIFAALIGILSQFTIPLGTIPLTLQTFAVGLVVTILGTRNGTVAVCIYLIMGMIGIPVFAGGSSGFGALLGPTGGFLIGFIFNALSTGIIINKTKSDYLWAIIANIIGSFVTLFFGTIWLKYNLDLSWTKGFAAGFTPFILPGLIKAAAAGYLGILIKNRIPKRIMGN